MSRAHQVDIVGPLRNEFPIDLLQTSYSDLLTKAVAADLVILAVDTLEGTAGKKDRARTVCTADTGFLPVM